MKRYTALLLIALLAVLAGQASSVPDDDDKVPLSYPNYPKLMYGFGFEAR